MCRDTISRRMKGEGGRRGEGELQEQSGPAWRSSEEQKVSDDEEMKAD